jgi:hypothetical protein
MDIKVASSQTWVPSTDAWSWWEKLAILTAFIVILSSGVITHGQLLRGHRPDLAPMQLAGPTK